MDFSFLDLSPWGIKGGFIEDPETEKHIKSISIDDQADRNWKHVKKECQQVEGGGKFLDWEYVNLLWPIDLDKSPEESDFFEAIEAIRVAHPSELYVRNSFGAQYFKGKGIYFSGWSTFTSYSYAKYKKPENFYFDYPADHIGETNEFLAHYKKHYGKRDYIRNAIRYYSDSFNVNSPEMAFICLCICLETIVPGKEQLSYRFRRNLAVLCSESAEKGNLIFKNARLLYDYRSSLVHSGMSSKDFKKFDLFFEYAQILSSRMIIAMILHDIPTIQELDKKITELGFGQGKELSENYNEFKGNGMTWYKVSGYKF